ncbi:MAG: hypothetical protein MJK04_00845 [Psychrosphaera sp.]|nr:hypothetical protein [Psychrosphaera sp.]
MKQLLKTTLLAAAIAATCGNAVAGDVSVMKQVHSTEGLNGVTANQQSKEISYKLGAAYREGDKITLTFPDGALATTGNVFASVINMPPINTATEANAIAGLTLGLLNSDANSVTYRVTKLTLPHNDDKVNTPVEWQNGSTLGAVLGTSANPLNVWYTAASVKAGAVTVTVSSQTTAGDILDSAGTRTATIAEAKSQFGSAKMLSMFSNVIDVSTARLSFVGTNTDTMKFEITNRDSTCWMNLATVNTSNATVYGTPGKMTGLLGTNFNTGGTKTFTANEAKLAISYAGMVTNDTIVFTAPAAKDAIVLEVQSFNTDLVYNWSSAGAVAGNTPIATGLASGAWTLNGATVNIPYMPYGVNASQIMYISNTGSQAGDILVTAFDENGREYNLGTVGIANKKTVTKIASMIGPKLIDAGFNGTKLSITITVNAPSADITVYASYNIGGSDRGFVNTDQYKGM